MASSNNNTSVSSQKSGASVFPLLILVALAIATGVLYYLGDRLGAIAMLPVVLGSAMGYRSGAWRMMSMVLGSVAGFYLAAPALQALLPAIESSLGRSISSPWIGLGVSGFMVGTIVTVVSLVIGWKLTSRFSMMKSLDQNLGLIIGGGKALALVVIALWTVLAMEPRMIQMHGAAKHDDEDPNSLFSRFLSIGDATRKSPCLRYLVAWNPVATNPTLNEMLNKGESMVRDIQSQLSAAQSGEMPAASKLTSMFGDLQGSQGLPANTESFSQNNVQGMFQQILEKQKAASK